ncbi:MAG: hypothetical protein MZW92_31305 [Comamonadaceae bacterium]|nr:hypothetical protein [Comamonadaceae bacterium]
MSIENSWLPIETAPPEETVLLCGESGMVAPNDRFVTLGYREYGYRKGQWLDIKNDLLSEHGWHPTHWLPMSALPSLPTIPRYGTKREEAAHYREALGAFLSPERFGYTVTPEVRDFVRVTLGMAPCETETRLRGMKENVALNLTRYRDKDGLADLRHQF